jgi:hypothetical protein
VRVSIFSIHDSKLGSFLQPFFSANKATAIRSVVQTLKDGDTNFSKFPSDFNLYFLGFFDDDSGSFESVIPENMGLLSQYIEQ